MTPFSDIYDRFLRKINDYRLANLGASDFEDRLVGWLDSAIIRFARCQNNLFARDKDAKTFTATLTEEEEEILSAIMVTEWLKPEINFILELRNQLNDTDFKMYSSANLLKQKQDLYNSYIDEADDMISKYTYNIALVDGFKNLG